MSLEAHQKSRSGHQISDSIFYRLGSQTGKQLTHTGLPASRCKKKGPFTIKHYVNDVKNHVGCLSKSIKKADQASKICFYSLGWSNEKQSTLAGLPTSTCKKITIHNITSNEEGQKPCWKSLGHLTKKQIRTSKISVSIVLTGQVKNSQHWRGYQQATSIKNHHSQ